MRRRSRRGTGSSVSRTAARERGHEISSDTHAQGRSECGSRKGCGQERHRRYRIARRRPGTTSSLREGIGRRMRAPIASRCPTCVDRRLQGPARGREARSRSRWSAPPQPRSRRETEASLRCACADRAGLKASAFLCPTQDPIAMREARARAARQRCARRVAPFSRSSSSRAALEANLSLDPEELPVSERQAARAASALARWGGARRSIEVARSARDSRATPRRSRFRSDERESVTCRGANEDVSSVRRNQDRRSLRLTTTRSRLLELTPTSCSPRRAPPGSGSTSKPVRES